VITLRKAIRTTIDESLLKEVKKQAIDGGMNLNDVLEDIIEMFIVRQEMNSPSDKPINGDTLLAAMSSEIKVALAKVCSDYNLSLTDTLNSFLIDISDAISKTIYMANFSRKEE
jgi:hypothetical protein